MVSDEDLLAATARDPAAFGEFYARHERAVMRYLYRRTGDAQLAADLCAESFAAALLASPRFRRGPEPAVAWLFGIARNVLGRSVERRRVEAKARRRLGMPPMLLDEETVDALDRLHAGRLLSDALDHLPPEQADAVRARVVDEREYEDIARELKTSEQVVRKRVSRGLAALRNEIEEPT